MIHITADDNSPIHVVILAAGLGTRMKSKLAKVLHRVGGMSLAEHVVRAASHVTPPSNITVVIGHQSDEVRTELAPLGTNFILQERQQGTGHALLACREALHEASGLLMVLYGDTPLLSPATLERLVERQRRHHAAATLITTHLEDPTGYGRVIVDDQGHVRSIVEQKAATPHQLGIHTINSGIYCFDARLLWKYIGEIRPDNPANEYYLTDIVAILNRHGHAVQSMEVKDSTELLGINTRVDLSAVDKIIRDRKARQLMLDGVTIEKPETVTIDAQVKVGPDSILEPFTRLVGTTVVGEDCRIGASSVIESSRIGDRVHVAALTHISHAVIHDDARVGPFSRLRQGADLGPGTHVGNFVELKNTHLGAGAKANHLAYLGDAQIGERVNVGAGTITCNYDGVSKHRTTIEGGAFIGSNSTLVAPVTVGEGSYIGAGSVITEDVPAESLALGRAHQVVKPGWVERKKKKQPGD
jgi:bifunctional UDP-N-acetylglucosamine pyrophosphorylase/glucosamine-1-phosphate N-acetyltransferase